MENKRFDMWGAMLASQEKEGLGSSDLTSLVSGGNGLPQLPNEVADAQDNEINMAD